MRTPKLTDAAVQAALALRAGWSLENGRISRTFTFPDFVAAMRFVNAVADAAEAADHHPDIDIRYNKVTLALTTHDSGGLTEKDFALAAQADTIAA
ncbi:4a-hydroxytetrahydrobiopterin dehydratase [Armatimonas rosea]|uniref:Putative pterin-4-alpha-carbinolamine dehydratase n=1 Tax=Armatimonas rosea TaxID=685828 RepID=A0A7W9W670_ARMRO|nr:4a-hydroxytetrahydrobiopterin dehydratase [Armatimonas rosea]MBB6050298.1 4a-hydroxytetrahydrobiopterin dehydratase [Armatimonas rosea]